MIYNKLLEYMKHNMINLRRKDEKDKKVQNVPENVSIDLYLDKDDLSPNPPLEGDEEVK